MFDEFLKHREAAVQHVIHGQSSLGEKLEVGTADSIAENIRSVGMPTTLPPVDSVESRVASLPFAFDNQSVTSTFRAAKPAVVIPNRYSLERFPSLRTSHSDSISKMDFSTENLSYSTLQRIPENINSIVQIKTPNGLGTGFFLNERGLGATNYHVESDAKNLFDVIAANRK